MTETIFTYGAPVLKFGDRAADEIGYDLAELGARRAPVLTDPDMAATGLPDRVAMKRQRLLSTAPRDVTAEDLAKIFRRTMNLW